MNDFSYLSIGDVDITKKKGQSKYRYQKETGTPSTTTMNDSFFFDGQPRGNSSSSFPDDHLDNLPPPLTDADFLTNDKNENKILMMQDFNDLGALGEMEEEGDNIFFDGNEDNDKAPEMPNEFYQQIDQFLKKPPPKVSLDEPGSSGKKKKKKQKASMSNPPHFPPIYQTSYDIYQKEYNLDNLPPPNMTINDEDYLQQLEEKRRGKKSKKKISLYQNPINPNKEAKPRVIDNHLLREAFAYTDQLLREAVIEEANSMANDSEVSKQAPIHPRSAPAELLHVKQKEIEDTYSSSGKGSKKKSSASASSKVSVIRQLKQNKQENATKVHHENAFSVGTGINDTEGPDLKRNALNFDELVYNFQHGVNLEKLRRELQQSKQSLAQSENVIKDLSHQYMRK